MKWENKVIKGNVFTLKECPFFWDHLPPIFLVIIKHSAKWSPFWGLFLMNLWDYTLWSLCQSPVFFIWFFFFTESWKKNTQNCEDHWFKCGNIFSTTTAVFIYFLSLPGSAAELHGRTLCLDLERVGHLNSQGCCFQNNKFSFRNKHLVLKITPKRTPSALLKHFTLETCHGDMTTGRHFLCWETEFHHYEYFNGFHSFCGLLAWPHRHISPHVVTSRISSQAL